MSYPLILQTGSTLITANKRAGSGPLELFNQLVPFIESGSFRFEGKARRKGIICLYNIYI